MRIEDVGEAPADYTAPILLPLSLSQLRHPPRAELFNHVRQLLFIQHLVFVRIEFVKTLLPFPCCDGAGLGLRPPHVSGLWLFYNLAHFAPISNLNLRRGAAGTQFKFKRDMAALSPLTAKQEGAALAVGSVAAKSADVADDDVQLVGVLTQEDKTAAARQAAIALDDATDTMYRDSNASPGPSVASAAPIARPKATAAAATGAASAATAVMSSNSLLKSAYELARDECIRQNEAQLRALGQEPQSGTTAETRPSKLYEDSHVMSKQHGRSFIVVTVEHSRRTWAYVEQLGYFILCRHFTAVLPGSLQLVTRVQAVVSPLRLQLSQS